MNRFITIAFVTLFSTSLFAITFDEIAQQSKERTNAEAFAEVIGEGNWTHPNLKKGNGELIDFNEGKIYLRINGQSSQITAGKEPGSISLLNGTIPNDAMTAFAWYLLEKHPGSEFTANFFDRYLAPEAAPGSGDSEAEAEDHSGVEGASSRPLVNLSALTGGASASLPIQLASYIEKGDTEWEYGTCNPLKGDNVCSHIHKTLGTLRMGKLLNEFVEGKTVHFAPVATSATAASPSASTAKGGLEAAGKLEKIVKLDDYVEAMDKNKADGVDVVIVKFGFDSCPPCQQIMKNFEELTGNFKVIEVDVKDPTETSLMDWYKENMKLPALFPTTYVLRFNEEEKPVLDTYYQGPIPASTFQEIINREAKK